MRLRELRDVGAGRERGPAARDDEARRRRADRVLDAGDEARAHGLRGSGIERGATCRNLSARIPLRAPRRTRAESAFTGGEVICSTATPFFRAHLTALLVAIAAAAVLISLQLLWL